jgi:hemerythrin-like domain-containing protein
MDAVRMLVHDHEVLTSQVEHVRALVRGLLGKTFAPESLYEELLQQVDSLRDQLLEHFGFEEEAAFPFLVNALPEHAETLRSLCLAHERVVRCLIEVVDLVRLTTRDTLGLQLGPIASAFERFANAYGSHVDEESEVLDVMQQQLTGSQRQALSDIARKLL